MQLITGAIDFDDGVLGEVVVDLAIHRMHIGDVIRLVELGGKLANPFFFQGSLKLLVDVLEADLVVLRFRASRRCD